MCIGLATVGALGDDRPGRPRPRPPHRPVRRALRAGPRGHPGRRELPGAGVQRGRRHARGSSRSGPGRLAHRRRRQRVRRPDLLVGPDAARPRPPRGAGGGRRRRSPAARRTAPRPSPRSSSPRRSCARTPVEQVRFVSSGTEATMSAIRLARGFTGRDVVVKFAGCYHGHVDSLLASAGSGLATFARARHPRRPGVVDRADPGAALQRPGRRRGGLRRARRPDRLPDHRGRARQHGRGPARARLQRVPRRDLRARTARCSSPTR